MSPNAKAVVSREMRYPINETHLCENGHYHAGSHLFMMHELLSDLSGVQSIEAAVAFSRSAQTLSVKAIIYKTPLVS